MNEEEKISEETGIREALKSFQNKSLELQEQAFALTKYAELANCLLRAKQLAKEVNEEVAKINFDFSFLEKNLD